MYATDSGGGCGMAFRPFLPPATLVYMTHSAVVSRSETALPLRTREKGGGRERPPQNRGSCGPAQMAFGTCLCAGPHGVAHVLIYPCGKAQKQPPFPSRFIVSDRSSPSRVRFAASRPGRLRADPKDALLTRGKGGGRAVGCEGESLAHDKGYYHSRIAAGTIDRFPPPDHRGNMWRHQ